jgi:hypothetical protein
MGLVIESGDEEDQDRLELWQSTYSTFATMQYKLREEIAASDVDDQLYQMTDQELTRLDIGLKRVPEFAGMVEWYKASLDQIMAQKRPQLIDDWWQNWQPSAATVPAIATSADSKDEKKDEKTVVVNEIRSGSELFFAARGDGQWTAQQCGMVLKFLQEFEETAREVIDETRGQGWYQALVRGLSYCVSKNVPAIFC